ncbi:hypothetical protein FSP39_018846 [Pinctada imbricata]|uniref:Uncharacterized protein n=1 Tax=Pinctada imbricata TaxID=66713 RepID=A0AA89C1Z8_PINIB|nr:hypothetical protein FSP39_018846 [Pinctada imbricata]
MISTVRLQQILTVGLLTYLYMTVLFMFQNSRYSTWQRYYRNLSNDSLPEEVYLSNITGVDYNNFEIPSEKVYYEYKKAAIDYPDSKVSKVNVPQVKYPSLQV